MSTLDNLRKEAKRWLKAFHAGDPSARQRLRLAWPGAPPEPGLRDIQHALARERGHDSWRALKADAERRTSSRPGATPPSGVDARVNDFLQFATWDHHVHGRGDYAATESAAMRLLAAHPEIATANLYTAIVCGEIDEVDRRLAADPGLAAARGGFRDWEPLLYLCYARLPVPTLREHALAIAARLLDRGASPNAYYMAGDAVYSALTGVAGEGEQDAPPHAARNALYELLLHRGADPYDIQVLYNTHFRGDVLWWLQLTYAYTVSTGRSSDWVNPDWPMFDTGSYGSGARFILWIAIEKNDVALARWALAHGANPDPAPARDPRFSKRSVYQDAVRAGCDEIAALLREHGAPVTALELDDHEAYLAACFRLDRTAIAAAHERHPEYPASPLALFAAARRDRADVVALLLDLGVPIEVEDEHHQRALHIAAGSDARRVAALLIERGAAIDPRETRYGGTPMGHAQHNDHRAMLDLLAPHSRNVWMLGYCARLERLADVLHGDASGAREVTPEGITPLFWLPDNDEQAVAVATLLMAHGADPAAVSNDGRTAADTARKRGLEQAAALLSSAATTRESGRATDLDGYDAIARAVIRVRHR